MTTRDVQRSKVYKWERSFNPPWRETMSLDECEALVRRVWKKERGRYGMAKRPPPNVSAARGARGSASRITLGRLARNPWVVLHELSHGLAGRERDGWHGPRFVAILIGVAARHLGMDPDAMIAAALEHGVRVDVRSVGRVPAFPWSKRVAALMPCTAMEAAVQLVVSYRVVMGAALRLVVERRARWRGRTLVAVS